MPKKKDWYCNTCHTDKAKCEGEHWCWRCLRHGTRGFVWNNDLRHPVCSAHKACKNRVNKKSRLSPTSAFLEYQPAYGHFGGGCYS